MASLNRVLIIGNACRDVECRYTPKGTAVADISLAVNNSYTDKATGTKKDEVAYIDCTAWGRTAEIAGEYINKGGSCLIEGRLQMESWDDKSTGQKRTKLKVVVENLQLLGGRESGQKSPARQQEKPAAQVDDSGFDDGGISDDVPF